MGYGNWRQSDFGVKTEVRLDFESYLRTKTFTVDTTLNLFFSQIGPHTFTLSTNRKNQLPSNKDPLPQDLHS